MQKKWLLPLGGAVLVLSVIAWRLRGYGYREDIAALCAAEERAEATLDKDAAKVESLIDRTLRTPEGISFYRNLQKKVLSERAEGLTSEAARLGFSSCKLATTYRELYKEGLYRADLAGMCVAPELSTIGELPPEKRIVELRSHIEKKGRSEKTPRFLDELEKLPVAERSARFKSEAMEQSIFHCEFAALLSRPKEAKGEKALRFGTAQVRGGLEEQEVTRVLSASKKTFTQCFEQAEKKGPEIPRQVVVAFSVSPKGEVSKTLVHTEVSDDLTSCLKKGLSGLHFSKVTTSPGPPPMVLVPFVFAAE